MTDKNEDSIAENDDQAIAMVKEKIPTCYIDRPNVCLF